MQTIQILLIPATVIGSVVLVCSCLFFKRLRRKKGNASSSAPNKNKSEKTSRNENSQIHGLTNTAFTVGNGDTDIYENDTNIYDYAKNERNNISTHGPGSKWSASDQNPNVSPLYADANDTTTSFYFTLERSATQTTGVTDGNLENTEGDEGSYVIVIPENIYDKPEDATELDTVTEGSSQFYYTLEECSEQNENDKELSCTNMVLKENSDSTDAIYDTTDETCENEMRDGVVIEIEEHDQMSEEDTYVVNIPNEVNGMKYNDNECNGNTEKQVEDSEALYVVNVPNDMNDSQNASTKMKDDGYSRQIGIEEEKYYACLEIEVDRNEEYSKKMRVEEDSQNSEKIYKNVNACLYPNNQERLSHRKSVEESSAHVKNAKNSKENAATTNRKENMKNTTRNITTENSQENMGYLDDEILTQSEAKENARQNKIDDENPLYTVIEADASESNECLSESDTRNDNQYKCYYDDDIYEDWEDNIIGRAKGKEQDQDSGCDTFYQNLRDFKPSLVMQDTR